MAPVRRDLNPQPLKSHMGIKRATITPLAGIDCLERPMGFEPTTLTLARLCSTPELQAPSQTNRRAVPEDYIKESPRPQDARPGSELRKPQP